MWKCVNEFDESLDGIREIVKSLSDAKISKDNADLETKIERMIDTCDQIKSTSMTFDEKVKGQSERALFLLSRKDDLERQVDEAKRLINEQRDRESGNTLGDQPLDAETEKLRRKLGACAVETQHSIAHVKTRLCLLIDVFESSEKKPKRSAYPFGSPRQTPSRQKKAQMALKSGVLRGYERAQQLSKTADSLQEQVKEAADEIASSKPSSSSARKSRTRIAPLPVTFTSPSAKKKSQSKVNQQAKAGIVQRQAAVENAIRALGQAQDSLHVKKFRHRGIIGSDAGETRQAIAGDWRSKGATSQLMSSVCTPLPKMGALTSVSTPPASMPPRSLFTPPPTSAGKGRSDWDVTIDLDQSRFETLQVKMPSTVRTVAASDAARKALKPFGTTPEKISRVQEVKYREDRQAAAASSSEQKAPSTTKKKPSSSSSSGLPPLSSTAPTPFSLKAPSTDKKAAPTKAESPPMPLSAPRLPFGSGSSGSGKSDKKEDSAAAAKAPSSAFPPMSIKAPSPFGGGEASSSKDSASKKDEGTTTKPFGGSSGSNALSNFGTDLSGGLSGASTAPASVPSQPDYGAILTNFFAANNPAKVGDVEKTLVKYKGHEERLFAKLAERYGVANPLLGEASSSPSVQASSKPPASPAVTSLDAHPASPLTAPSTSTSTTDYRAVLTNFYQTHNPSHVGDVDKLLAKYNGRELDMFARLAKKYKVPNPLEASIGERPSAPAPSEPFGSSGGSLFSGSTGNATASPSLSSVPSNAPPPSPFSTAKAPAPSPFGPPASNAPAPLPFGAPSSAAPSPSPFAGATGGGGGGLGGTTSTPFKTAAAPSPSPFGQSSMAAATTPFGAPSASATPFGQPASSATSPFASPPAPATATSAPGATKLFNGKSARDMLTSFYQQRDPSKLSKLDFVLTKYAGQEELMFRNLAKKYNLDPSVFGVSAAPAAPAAPATSAFGAQSPGMGSPGFGQQSALGGSLFGVGSPAAPASGLGSAGGFGQASSMSGSAPAFGGGTGGFGSLAQAPATGGFPGAAPATFGGAGGGGFGSATGGFGSPGGLGGGPSPFGSARR